MMQLFIIHVGYYDYDVGMYELHTQFLIPALSAAEAKAKTMAKDIFQAKKMHIDGIQEVNQVDGYAITLHAAANYASNRIYNYNEIKAL